MPSESPFSGEEEPYQKPKSNTMLILLAGLCAFLAVPFSDYRDVEFPLRFWKLHATYLDGMAMTLSKYQKVHDHFPDNNQGLQSLDTFESRFELFMEPKQSEWVDTAPADPAKFFSRQIGLSFREIRNQIHNSRDQTGRLPKNPEEMPFLPFYGSSLTDDGQSRRVQVAISENDCLYLLGPNGVFDPSITPYGYENRNGLDAKLFADSIANNDPGRNYSRELSPGVYVYSYNAMSYYRKYRNNLIARRVNIFLPGGLAVGLIVLAAYRSDKYGLRMYPLVFPTFAALLAFGAVPRVSCYKTSSMPRREPKDLEAQKRMLENFRGSGVITAETYAKAMQGFQTDAVFVPPKDPNLK